MIWKQISTQSNDQINIKTGSVKSTKVVRFLNFWQMPHVWLAPNTELNYDDIRANALDPSINGFYEVLYTNPMLGTTYSDLTN